MKTQKRRELKKKRRVWYNVYASKDFKHIPIGETVADDPGKLVGRTIGVNLANLVNDGRMQNVEVTFKINSVQDGKAQTSMTKYELLPMHVKRIVRLTKERVDDSFECTTKDGFRLRLKPIFITRHFTTQGVLGDLKKKAREYLKELLQKEDYGQFVQRLIRHQVQQDMRYKLQKIYPLGVAELRTMEVVKVPSTGN